jgi:hypothetical protein
VIEQLAHGYERHQFLRTPAQPGAKRLKNPNLDWDSILSCKGPIPRAIETKLAREGNVTQAEKLNRYNGAAFPHYDK